MLDLTDLGSHESEFHRKKIKAILRKYKYIMYCRAHATKFFFFQLEERSSHLGWRHLVSKIWEIYTVQSTPYWSTRKPYYQSIDWSILLVPYKVNGSDSFLWKKSKKIKIQSNAWITHLLGFTLNVPIAFMTWKIIGACRRPRSGRVLVSLNWCV